MKLFSNLRENGIWRNWYDTIANENDFSIEFFSQFSFRLGLVNTAVNRMRSFAIESVEFLIMQTFDLSNWILRLYENINKKLKWRRFSYKQIWLHGTPNKSEIQSNIPLNSFRVYNSSNKRGVGSTKPENWMKRAFNFFWIFLSTQKNDLDSKPVLLFKPMLFHFHGAVNNWMSAFWVLKVKYCCEWA